MPEATDLIPATTELFLDWLQKMVPQVAEPTAEVLSDESYRLQYFSQLYHRQEVERLIHLWNAQQENLNNGQP
jgi:hypothetical protein